MDLKQVELEAFPQPGTTNLPYPIGPVPAFKPVVTEIVDTDAAAILSQTVQIVLELKLINADLFQINANLAKIVSNTQLTAKGVHDLDVMVPAYSTVVSSQTAIEAMRVASQIQTNNFNKAMVPEDQRPQLPTPEMQYEKGIFDAIDMNIAARTAGTIVNFASEYAGRTVSWITGTETYKETTGWLKRQIDALKAAIFPPGPDTTASAAKALTVTKVP